MRQRRATVLCTSLALAATLAAPASARHTAAESLAVNGAASAADAPDVDLSQPQFQQFLQQQVSWSSDICPTSSLASPASLANAPKSANASKLAEPGDPVEPPATECARVTVPMDWRDVSKGTIFVGISRAKADAPVLASRSKRLLLSNPGGPGGSGLDMGLLAPLMVGSEQGHVGVGIDPRGVNLSSRLSCDAERPKPAGSHQADGDSRTYTRAEVAATQRYWDDIVRDCAAEPLAQYLNTVQTARDFNFVRALLGYDTADYYGISYGTWLGAAIKRMFPSHFDRVLLDANADWAAPSLHATMERQVFAFQAAFDKVMVPYFARHDAKFKLGSTTNDVHRTIERLRARAARGEFGPILTADALDRMLVEGLYDPAAFDGVGQSISGLVHGEVPEESPFARLGGAQGLSVSTHLAVLCGDGPNPVPAEQRFAQVEVHVKNLPLLGGFKLASLCNAWPHAPAIDPTMWQRPVRGVLALHNEADPATPYRGINNIAARGTGARVITIDDAAGHGAPLGDVPCAMEPVQRFMTTGELPATDIGCQGAPLGLTGEREIYEFFNPKTPDRTHPKPYLYVMRDLAAPRLDVAATNAWQAANPVEANPADPNPADPELRSAPADLKRKQATTQARAYSARLSTSLIVGVPG